MAPKLQQLFDWFSFSQKTLTYANGERSNLQTCVTTLNYVILCNNLAMLEPFDGSNLGMQHQWKNNSWAILCKHKK